MKVTWTRISRAQRLAVTDDGRRVPVHSKPRHYVAVMPDGSRLQADRLRDIKGKVEQALDRWQDQLAR